MNTIIKHSDAVHSECECRSPYALFVDYGEPWGGDGFMFRCFRCNRHFVVGRVIEDGLDRETLADRMVDAFPHLPHYGALMEIDVTAEALAAIPLGTLVVHLDGEVLPIHQRDVVVDGLTRQHTFQVLPHATAWHTGSDRVLMETLGDDRYWTDEMWIEPILRRAE